MPRFCHAKPHDASLQPCPPPAPGSPQSPGPHSRTAPSPALKLPIAPPSPQASSSSGRMRRTQDGFSLGIGFHTPFALPNASVVPSANIIPEFTLRRARDWRLPGAVGGGETRLG